MVLQPGIYTVTAKAEGFRDVVHRNIHLFVPGGVTDNIGFEVSAIDIEIGPIDRQRLLDSDLADAFSRRDLADYPLFDRNPLALALLQPGVQLNGGAESASTVNGTQPGMNALTRDGLTMTDYISPGIGRSMLSINIDALSGVQILTSNAGAEYGGAGGAQVVLTSRRGAQNWNGNLFNYFNSHHLDANEYFNNFKKIDKPESMRNLFGGVISGKLNDKTAIFGSYEGNRTEQQVYRNRLVLTDDARTGVFKWYAPDDDYRTSTTVKSMNIISRDPRGIGMDPSVANAIGLMPLSNNTFIGDKLNTAGYEFYNDLRYYYDHVDARVDYSLNPRHQIFFRFGWNRTNATDIQNGADAAYPGLNSGDYKTRDFNIVFGSDYTLSPTMINELRVGYARASVDYERPDRLTEPMFYSSIWFNPRNTSSPISYRNPSFEISDTFSHSRNVHSFKYGVSLRRHAFGNTDYTGAYPTVTFGNSFGNIPDIGPSEQVEISTADRGLFENFYNTMLGRIESVNQTFHLDSNISGMFTTGSPKERNFATWSFNGFVQDNWKIKPNITINLGLRYELFTSPKESNGYQISLEQASLVNADANISDFRIKPGGSWTKSDKLNFAPRIGLAWDAFGTGSTVIRAAYGIYYDHINGGIANFIDQTSYGFENKVTEYPNENGTDFRLSDGVSVTPPALPALQPDATRSQSIAILDYNLKTPRIQQMHATLERRWAKVLWEIGFSRTRGTNLFQYINLNQTKISDDFRDAFLELQAYRANGVPVSADNVIAGVFGSPNAAFEALSGYNFDSGRMGVAADILDREHHDSMVAAGLSDFYIRNFPQFDRFYYGTNAVESWYEALRAGVRKSGANYGFKAFYTWSRFRDTLSSSDPSYIANLDSFNTASAKGYSDSHRSHVFNMAWRYAFPFGRDIYDETDQPGWVNALLAGWNASVLMKRSSGARFSVNSGIETQYAGVYSRADLERTDNTKIGKYYRDRYDSTLYWIDPSAAQQFKIPEAGYQGTSARNAFTGPGYFNLDVAMYKNFYIRQSQAFQIRLEAYNVFNNTHLGLPDTNLTSSEFGRITSTVGTPRKMQFALRYQF